MCQDPVQAEDLWRHRRDHGWWQRVLFDWDHGTWGDRAWLLMLPVGDALFLGYLIALLRDRFGIG
ncbi:hypothetical protein [Micromonospora sp. DT227]|uniref:hypothetical protein n=1 Tax=Micromonospora sp. DT227 TaxID=3393433 RepID=UPI003CF19B63